MEEKIKKIFSKGKTIPVVFATDKNFVPYMYVAITSLIENSSKNNNYDIVILYTDIDEYNIEKLQKLSRDNISIRFFNMSAIMEEYKDIWYTHWAYTEAMYYRFIIPQIFADYEKILYLDGDIIINCDIAELYDIDLGNNLVGAVTENSIRHEKSPAYNYVKPILHIEKEKYFSSGVMVFNVKKLSKIDFFNNCIEVLNNLKTPIFPDQDVLNIICKDKVKYLDISYNLTWNITNRYKDIEKYITKKAYISFQQALKNPKILHYCGACKPWKQPELEYSEYWWKYARITPFYEDFLFNNISKPTLNRNAIKHAVLRRSIYFKYLKCKILKIFTFGNTKQHYIQKSHKLKSQIKDYRKTLSK